MGTDINESATYLRKAFTEFDEGDREKGLQYLACSRIQYQLNYLPEQKRRECDIDAARLVTRYGVSIEEYCRANEYYHSGEAGGLPQSYLDDFEKILANYDPEQKRIDAKMDRLALLSKEVPLSFYGNREEAIEKLIEALRVAYFDGGLTGFIEGLKQLAVKRKVSLEELREVNDYLNQKPYNKALPDRYLMETFKELPYWKEMDLGVDQNGNPYEVVQVESILEEFKGVDIVVKDEFEPRISRYGPFAQWLTRKGIKRFPFYRRDYMGRMRSVAGGFKWGLFWLDIYYGAGAVVLTGGEYERL